MVSAGAKILGSFTIGENSKIGAGSVVLEEVPPNCTVVGVPGRIVRMGSRKVPRTDMDQIHLPDPVLNDIKSLQEENQRLHNELKHMIKYMKCFEKEDYECPDEEEDTGKRKNQEENKNENLQYNVKEQGRFYPSGGGKGKDVCLRSDRVQLYPYRERKADDRI